MMTEILLSSAMDIDGAPLPLPGAILTHLDSAPRNEHEEEQQMKEAMKQYEEQQRFDPTTLQSDNKAQE